MYRSLASGHNAPDGIHVCRKCHSPKLKVITEFLECEDCGAINVRPKEAKKP